MTGKLASVGRAQGELPLVQAGGVRGEVEKAVPSGLRLDWRARDVHYNTVRVYVRVAGARGQMVEAPDNQGRRSHRFRPVGAIPDLD